MKILKVTLIVIAIIIAIIIVVCAYYGSFKKIEFRTEEQGGETVVYEHVTGDYSQSPAILDKVYYSLLNDEKIETTKGFGIYYDNPKVVEKSKLRSEIGSIIDNPDSTMMAKLSIKYEVKILPKGNYVVTEFPFKGQMSVLFGLFKVYPALEKYCKENGIKDSPITEIYDVPNKKIIYRKEIIK